MPRQRRGIQFQRAEARCYFLGGALDLNQELAFDGQFFRLFAFSGSAEAPEASKHNFASSPSYTVWRSKPDSLYVVGLVGFEPTNESSKTFVFAFVRRDRQRYKRQGTQRCSFLHHSPRLLRRSYCRLQ